MSNERVRPLHEQKLVFEWVLKGVEVLMSDDVEAVHMFLDSVGGELRDDLAEEVRLKLMSVTQDAQEMKKLALLKRQRDRSTGN